MASMRKAFFWVSRCATNTDENAVRPHIKLLTLFWLMLVVVICMAHHHYYTQTFHWFNDALPTPSEVSQWSEETKENGLFRLSHWGGFASGRQFRRFIKAQIRPMDLDSKNKSFHFLEVGMGVGAFARVILDMYPECTGAGIDIAPAAIEIAKVVLPSARMKPSVGNMQHLPMYGGSTFDAIFVPGALCLLFSMDEVRAAVSEFYRVLKSEGQFCISLIPDHTSQAGACNLRIPKPFWAEEMVYWYDLKLLSLEDMDAWHLPHSMGRYHVCMQKKRS